MHLSIVVELEKMKICSIVGNVEKEKKSRRMDGWMDGWMDNGKQNKQNKE